MGPLTYLATSVAVLTPCYWQSRIQAGDLASHVYNAWLAESVASGSMPGLVLVDQTTNVLFDLVLAHLLPMVGVAAAQRIAVSIAVLIFFWGAFAFVSVISGRRAWGQVPVIAMLAYGWVFHSGFFNFYLSLGLCFAALALAWDLRPRRLVIASSLIPVAYLAHVLPVVWALAVVAYLAIARFDATSGRRLVLLAPAILILVHWSIDYVGMTVWSPRQLLFATGLNQLFVYDARYLAPTYGLLAVWVIRFSASLRERGTTAVLSSGTLGVAAITALGTALLPDAIRLPGAEATLGRLAERMSLATAILLCAVLASRPQRRFERAAAVGFMLLYFSLLYRDGAALNAFEDRLEAAVAGLPPRERVVIAVGDPEMRIWALAHLLDRACIDRCYGYANYEPSSGYFRIRAVAENPFVAATYEDSWMMQKGTYVVKERDLPLYAIGLGEGDDLKTRALEPGLPIGSARVDVLPDLF